MSRLSVIAVSLSLTSLLLTACGPAGLAIGAGAAVGTAASREGGIGQTMTDTRIKAYINDAWFKRSTAMFSKLNLNVTEGRVLITGIVQDQQTRLDAVRLAWQAPGVTQVINEIKVENSEGISGYTRDSWIATQLRSKMIFDKDIESINYSTEIVASVVYLMGVAQSQDELNRVISHARGIRYVKEVVSYVRLRGQSVEQSTYEQGSSGLSNNAYSNNATPSTANYSNNSGNTTSSGSYDNTVNNASSNYDYQPESRGTRAPVESSDLPPPTN
ncbi:MAG TPA: BON domain-containing protein [Alphaproteobacteria bacterium]